MGKNAKEHKKKVAARNERIKIERAKFQKTYETMMKERMEQLVKGFSSLDNVEVVDVIENGESIIETPTEEQ